jgi:hypothetical protein
MSIKAILTTLILGSSSMALAAPTATVNVNSGMVVRDHRPIDVDGAWFRNHRHPRPQRKPPVKLYANASYTYAPSYPVYELPVYRAPVASTVMAPTSLVAGQIELDVQKPSIEGKTTLRVSAVGGGTTYIDKIVLNTWSHATQVIDLHASLDSNNPYYDIPLASCSDLGGIVIDGQSMYGGAISITAF